MTGIWTEKWERLGKLNVLFKMFDISAEVYYTDTGDGTPYRICLHDEDGDEVNQPTMRVRSFQTIEELEAVTHRYVTACQISI